MVELTPYEREQVRQISGWKAESPFLVIEMMERAAHPLVKFAKHFIPDKAVSSAVEVAYKASEIFAHEEEITERASVAEVHELRDFDLEVCDRLAVEFARKAGEGALVRGAIISSTGGMGAVLGLEVMIMYALKCVHTVGFCYGFTPDDYHERDCAMSILLVAAAGSRADKQKALHELQSMDAAKIRRDALDEMGEEAAETLAEEALETLAEEAMEKVSRTAVEEVLTERVLESTALSAIPFLGILFGGISDAAVAQYIGETARRVFQERWLRINRKVTHISPDPMQSRSGLLRMEGLMGAGVYWTTFATSFVISWPVLMLASFVPRNSVIGRGCAHGSSDAVRDNKALWARMRKPAPKQSPSPATGAVAVGNT